MCDSIYRYMSMLVSTLYPIYTHSDPASLHASKPLAIAPLTCADDDVDRLLTEKGVEQALRAGKRLQELINGGRVPPIKTLYKSTMIRAAQTADLILANLDPATLQGPGQVQACSMIREGACAVPEPEISRASWDVCETDFHRDSIRIESAFRNHVHRADKGSQESYTTVLVCHGNVIRYLTMRALQLDPQAWLRLSGMLLVRCLILYCLS